MLDENEWSQRVTELFENLPDEVGPMLNDLTPADLLGVIEPPQSCGPDCCKE